MFRYRYIISFLLLLCCCAFCRAQTNKDHIDTDVAKVDSVVYRGAADTAFIKNELSVSKDSMRSIKKTSGFEYVDSLEGQLKDMQKAQAKNGRQEIKSNWLFNILTSKITAYIFWTIAIAFVVFLLYHLFLAQGVFKKRYTKIKVSKIENKEVEVLTAADYDKLIKEAVINGDYRLATRYQYLQSLQILADKGLISLAVDKVNYQYVRELQGKPYKADFAELTLNYEYIWYGEFGIGEEDYGRISNHFKLFNNQL